MQSTTQHALTQHVATAGTAAARRDRRRTGAGRRALHRALAIAAAVTAFAFAGQSMAQADQWHGDRRDGQESAQDDRWWDDEWEATPALAPALVSAPAASGSVRAYQDYALGQLGGDTAQSECLNVLWRAESGWNPDAQNPTSTAYGIAQFLDSTWAGTGIAKTSDPYRQIDAGLIYIKNRYGTPCEAWSFHQENNWY
jgi:hypothetical protein